MLVLSSLRRLCMVMSMSGKQAKGKLLLNPTPFTGIPRAPCLVAHELLTTLLDIVDEYVDEYGHIHDDIHKTVITAESYRSFTHSLSELSVLSILPLSHAERLSFYLNIYHLLLLHTLIVLGKPKGQTLTRSHLTFFTKCCYKLGDLGYVDSTEIEHGLLRAPMTKPHTWGARFFPHFGSKHPKYLYGLQEKEPLLAFALCCGAKSAPRIRIYPVDGLSSVLADATRTFIRSTVVIHPSRRQIWLPKLLDWYRADFSTGSDLESILSWLLPWLDPCSAALVQRMYMDDTKTAPAVKFFTYDWSMFYVKDPTTSSTPRLYSFDRVFDEMRAEGSTLPLAYQRMRHPHIGVKIKDHIHHFKKYRNCFSGNDAVEWLMKEMRLKERSECVSLLNNLLLIGAISSVTLHESQFRDSSTSFYIFESSQDEIRQLTEITTVVRAHLPIRDEKYRGRIYQQVFFGRELVDCLMNLRDQLSDDSKSATSVLPSEDGAAAMSYRPPLPLTTRDDCIAACIRLMANGFIRHVDRKMPFKDDTHFYTFLTKKDLPQTAASTSTIDTLRIRSDSSPPSPHAITPSHTSSSSVSPHSAGLDIQFHGGARSSDRQLSRRLRADTSPSTPTSLMSSSPPSPLQPSLGPSEHDIAQLLSTMSPSSTTTHARARTVSQTTTTTIPIPSTSTSIRPIHIWSAFPILFITCYLISIHILSHLPLWVGPGIVAVLIAGILHWALIVRTPIVTSSSSSSSSITVSSPPIPIETDVDEDDSRILSSSQDISTSIPSSPHEIIPSSPHDIISYSEPVTPRRVSDEEDVEEKQSSTPTLLPVSASSSSIPTSSASTSTSSTSTSSLRTPTPITYPLIVTDEYNLAGPQSVIINSHEPVPIENEWFKGRAVLKIRSSPLDPFYSTFFSSHPKLQFELVVQGQFKVRTKNIVYLGAEVGHVMRPAAMKLGVITKGVCRVLLKIVSGLTHGLSYSLGSNTILPHMVFPLMKSADRITITPAGQTPPDIMHDMIPGSVDKKTADPRIQFDPNVTYSISFFSQNLNLFKWKAVNLPGLKDMDFKPFWSDNPLRLVAYELLDENAPHELNNKKYIFGFSIQHLGNGNT